MTKKDIYHDDSGEARPGGQGGGAAAGDDAGSCVSFLFSWRLIIVSRKQPRPVHLASAQPSQGRIDIYVVKTMVKTNVQMIMTTTTPTNRMPPRLAQDEEELTATMIRFVEEPEDRTKQARKVDHHHHHHHFESTLKSTPA